MESLKGFFGVQPETRASAASATLSPFGAGKCSSPEDRFSWKDSAFQARAQETARRTTITSARLPLPILVSRSVCGWATLCKIQKMLRHWQSKRNENKVKLPMTANDGTMICLFKWQVSFFLYCVSFMGFFLSIKRRMDFSCSLNVDMSRNQCQYLTPKCPMLKLRFHCSLINTGSFVPTSKICPIA